MPDGSVSDLRDRCMSRFKYCSSGLDEARYKQLTCAQKDCPAIFNQRNYQLGDSGVKNTFTEDYIGIKKSYRVEVKNKELK